MKQRFTVTGMSCSACSQAVEKAVKRVEGVTSVSVSLTAGTMLCTYNSEGPNEAIDKEIVQSVKRAGFGAEVYKGENVSRETSAKEKQRRAEKKKVAARLIASAVFLIPLMYITMGHMLSLPFTEELRMPQNGVKFLLLQLILTLPVLVLGRSFFIKGFKSLFKGSPTMDTLVSIGASAAVIYSAVMLVIVWCASVKGDFVKIGEIISKGVYFESAAMVLTLVTVGKFLEARAKEKTTGAVSRLKNLVPERATVLKNGEEVSVSVKDLALGDIVILKQGETSPIDGVVEGGTSSIDVSALTGEGIPVDVLAGSEIMAGSICLDGAIQVRATQVASQTTLSKMISLVEEAEATKAPAQRLADKISGYFVPFVIGIALITGVIWLIASKDIGFALERCVSVLVVSCPCALGLATPVAVTAAMGRCASRGILIKSADVIEALEKTQVVFLDKTGTVTVGEPNVTYVALAEGVNRLDFIDVALTLEANSSHPLGKAIAKYAQNNGGKSRINSNFTAIFGKGAVTEGENGVIIGGNRLLMEEYKIPVESLQHSVDEMEARGETVIYVAEGARLLGVAGISDPPRYESRGVVSELKEMGLEVVMLTGDSTAAGNAVGKKVGIEKVICRVLPGDKEKIIREYEAQGKKTVMVGDGVNDSPALAAAGVGVSLGGATDIAVDAAQVVLMNSSLKDLPGLISFSHRAVKIIKENLFWAFFYNVLCIPLAAGALYNLLGVSLSPMAAAGAMSISSLFVVLNALRLYRK